MRPLPLLALLCMLAACGQSSSSPDAANNATDKTADKTPGKPTAKANVMKFVKHEVIDNQGTQMVASTYLIPEGWTAQDQLYWEYNDAVVPIRYKGFFRSADGNMSIQSFPDVRATWHTGPSGTNGYPPPSDLISGIKKLIETERKGVSYRVTDEKVISNSGPQKSYQQGSEVVSNSSAGLVRIELQENGQAFEEEFYAQLDVSDLRMPSAMGNMQTIVWAASSLYSCKALKGKLEGCRRIALTAKSSAQLTLPFYNKLAQVTKMLSDQVYARIYQAGQISRIISQTNDQVLESIRSSYQETQRANDRIHGQFSDYLRGVDRYSDGQTQVQLPSGYANAWVKDKGEYLLSDTQGYDPNSALSGNWKALDKR